jgi:hypothetical protein
MQNAALQRLLRHWQFRVRAALWTALLVALALTIFLVMHYVQRRTLLASTAIGEAQQQADRAAETIDGIFGEAMVVADTLTRDLSAGTLEYRSDALIVRIRSEFETRPDLDGIAVAFAPFVADPAQELYQIYLNKQVDGSLNVTDGATYNYTLPQGDNPEAPVTDWYLRPLAEGPLWLDPFLATGARKVLIEYAAPFTAAESGQPGGVVTVDYSLQNLRELMSKLELGSTGYGFVIANNGVFLAHPESRLVAEASLFDSTPSIYGPEVEAAARQALAGTASSVELRDPVTEQEVVMLFEPLRTTGWAVGIVLNKSSFELAAKDNLRAITGIALAIGLCVLLSITLIARIDSARTRTFWIVSASFSLIALALIVVIWLASARYVEQRGVVVANSSEVDRYLEQYEQSHNVNDAPLLIPTGIQITALQFPSPTVVMANGYYWQRWPANTPDTVARGVRFPQHLGTQIMLEEVERRTIGDEETIIWEFGIEAQQRFDPGRYPFDQRNITVELAPQELERNVILTPDFNNYQLISPGTVPGIDRNVQINNWLLHSSYFTYQLSDGNTNFGLILRDGRGATPTLNYVVEMRRAVTGPFIAYLVPGLVTVALLFAFLLSDRQVGDTQDMLTALSYAAALFFVIAVTHTALRDSIAAVGITYLEHLYIWLYIATIVIIINVFLVVYRPQLFFVQYRDNLIAKLVYWPLFAGVLLISTLFVFVL